MIDTRAYIKSGIIENYCLGLANPQEIEEMFTLCEQFPEIKQHLEKSELALEAYVKSFERKLPPSESATIKDGILSAIESEMLELNSEGMFNRFIDISKSSNFAKLEALIKDIHPPADFESVHVKTLYNSGGKELHLVWVKDLVPMEEHPHLDESFLVLEGTADCNIDGVITKMKRGDFMRIPPESHHEVVVTSSYHAKAIQSRITIG